LNCDEFAFAGVSSSVVNYSNKQIGYQEKIL